MSETIDSYLKELKNELSGSDPALIQDAVYDAQEYLYNAVGDTEQARGSNGRPESAVIPADVIEKYGTPAEVAHAYLEAESRLNPAPSAAHQPEQRSGWARFFGVAVDPRTYAVLLYMLFSLVTGIIYFTWVVTGVSVSVGLMVLVIGLPILGLFLASVKAIALMEGRLVEALLGVRMPRRPVFDRKGGGWWKQFKSWLSDGYTWSAMAYMFIKLPLGIIYFTLTVTFVSVSLSLAASPIWYYSLRNHVPIMAWNDQPLPEWALPGMVILGVLMLFGTLHLFRALGRMHGALAKGMLVRA